MPKNIIQFSLLVFLIFFLPIKGHKPDSYYLTDIEREIFFANKTSMTLKHQEFILKVMPLIQNTNREILDERERLKEIISLITLNKEIKQSEEHWVKRMTIKYSDIMKSIKLDQDKEKVLSFLSELLTRIDIVPVRLAIAQSAIESGWGDSRFCIEGNSYFGIHCYTPGCGIKANSNKQSGFEVKSYRNAQESASDYLLFLNSKRGMQSFRNERINYYYKDSLPNLSRLAGSIKGYSEIGQYYHDMIESILKNYIPDNISDY